MSTVGFECHKPQYATSPQMLESKANKRGQREREAKEKRKRERPAVCHRARHNCLPNANDVCQDLTSHGETLTKIPRRPQMLLCESEANKRGQRDILVERPDSQQTTTRRRRLPRPTSSAHDSTMIAHDNVHFQCEVPKEARR